MTKILAISGSPVEKASVDILLETVAGGVCHILGKDAVWEFVKLNNLSFVPCQSCGKAPEEGYCFIEDDMTDLYRKIVECDLMLVGSPVYFDTVSAQTKMFIDRCNCFRPADFKNIDPDHNFIKKFDRKRPAAMILVGGERGWFEGARRVIAGFFKWLGFVDEGVQVYRSPNFHCSGTVLFDKQAITDAGRIAEHLARQIREC